MRQVTLRAARRRARARLEDNGTEARWGRMFSRGRAPWFTCCLALGCSHEDAATARDTPAVSAQPNLTSSGAAPSSDASSSAPSGSAPPNHAPPIRVAFAGDVCLSLNVGTNLDKQKEGVSVGESVGPGYPFTHVVERLKTADVLIGNLECVLSLRGKPATEHNPFRCSMSSPEVLLQAGFDRVGIANNHAMDFGTPAFHDMLANLDRAGLEHFGQETFTRKPQAPSIHEVRGVKVGLLAYYWPPDLPLVDVTQARPLVDVLFVFMHWGMDDEPRPMELQRRLARDFIDAGVDVVVGTHSHVLQPTDWYNGKFIAYGLGNFVFSGMMHTPAHRIGALLEVDIAPNDHALTHRMIRTQLEADGAPRWLDDPATVKAVAKPPAEPAPAAQPPAEPAPAAQPPAAQP